MSIPGLHLSYVVLDTPKRHLERHASVRAFASFVALLMPFVLGSAQPQFYRWRAANAPVSDIRLAGAIHADHTLMLPESIRKSNTCLVDTLEHKHEQHF